MHECVYIIRKWRINIYTRVDLRGKSHVTHAWSWESNQNHLAHDTRPRLLHTVKSYKWPSHSKVHIVNTILDTLQCLTVTAYMLDPPLHAIV